MFDPSIGAGTRFKKGSSGNAGGRPKSRLLSEALRNRLAEVKQDDPAGRTFAEAIAENLVRIACSEGLTAVHAANQIADRIEGRARQSIEVADITAELRNKSDAELQFYLNNNRWPDDAEKAVLSAPVSAPTT
jgi:DNA polymerase III delta prime subunit